MRRVRSLAGLLLILPSLSVAAVELDDILQALLDQALTVTITARVTENGRETVQSYELTRVTISGRAVRLRLEGRNVVVMVEFTPYEEADGSILLVAQGEIWLREHGEEEVQYRTSVGTIPIQLGESALFYPLGMPFDLEMKSETPGRPNIELEVVIESYRATEG